MSNENGEIVEEVSAVEENTSGVSDVLTVEYSGVVERFVKTSHMGTVYIGNNPLRVWCENEDALVTRESYPGLEADAEHIFADWTGPRWNPEGVGA